MNAAYATKEREAQIREREVAIQAEIEADLYRQAETERELEASHRAAEQSEMAKIEAAKELQKDIQQQLIQKEQEKEFAYQQDRPSTYLPLRISVTYLQIKSAYWPLYQIRVWRTPCFRLDFSWW